MPSITSLCKKTKFTQGDRSFLASVFTRFSELVEMSPQTFANNNYKIARNFAPIEFVAVAVLISVYMNKRNNNMLIGDIAAMRQETRKALADFRMDNVSNATEIAICLLTGLDNLEDPLAIYRGVGDLPWRFEWDNFDGQSNSEPPPS